MAHTILILCGPTASGKSARALEIAQGHNGVIINADAMQVYRELRILTARPSEEEETLAPHRLYGVLGAAEPCSVARWLGLAHEAVDRTLVDGRLPIMTGGTGLYLKALMDGLSPIPDITPDARMQATRLWAQEGAGGLARLDPLMAAQLKPGDRQRHIRALEVMLSTGKSLRYWQSLPRERPYPDVAFSIEQAQVPREELYRRCDTRLLAMMAAGALDEVRDLLALQLSADLPAMRAVGVPELIRHLRGEISLEEAVTAAQQATRNYTKRQLTWFRHQLKAD